MATSQDGIHFTKYEGNPVLTWFPNLNGEEGAVSSGLTLGGQGETILFYGANTQESSTTVNADVRVASSLDGFNFTDLGIVLHHKDRSVWGSGDKLFSVEAIYDSGQWMVYYIPNGTTESGQLGVAHGRQYDVLDQSSAVTSGGQPISVWGTASHARLTLDTYALVTVKSNCRLEIFRGHIKVPSPKRLCWPTRNFRSRNENRFMRNFRS